jgi:transcription elongation factor GreA
MLKIAKVVEKSHATSTIGIGSRVKVDIEGDTMDYEIVGPTESDIEHGKISSESPVGRALLGHAKGDKVTVLAPGGEVIYKIVEVK